jgi:S1-C subfamily serine protease
VVRAIAAVKPAVVYIIAQDAAREPLGSGTGFIVDRDGFVVTNAHVVEDAARITVVINDKDEFSAQVVGVDEDHDLALLKLPVKVPRCVSFDSAAVKEGAGVLVTGYPFGIDFEAGGLGLTATTTKGTITAVREAESFVRQAPMKLIQMDATVNPGNSGGPVYRQDTGKVIGVVTGEVRLNPLEQTGINPAIPAEYVFVLAKAVREGKAAVKPGGTMVPAGPPSAEDPNRRPVEVERQQLLDAVLPETTELEVPEAGLPGGGLVVKAEGGHVLADPERPRVYVTENKLNALAVVNVDENRVEKRLFVGSAPVGLALSPDNSTLYVAASGGSQITFVDLKALKVTGGIQLGLQPYDVACPEAGKLYVTVSGNQSFGTVHLVDLKTKVRLSPERRSRSHVGGNALIAAHRGSPTVWFGETGGGAGLYRCDYTADPLRLHYDQEFNPVGGNLRDVRASPEGKLLYVCCGAPYYVQVREVNTLTPVGQLDTGSYPQRVAPSPDGSRVYATHGERHVDVFDAKTFLKIGSFAATSEPVNIVISNDSKRLVVAFANGLWIKDVRDMGPIIMD